MNKLPLISLGLPVYNGSNFLEETLGSILDQSFSDFELIISDNASTDKTYEICKNFAEKDSRIILTRNDENLGAAFNYNKVFSLAKGKYFKWASHDDLYDKDYLAKLVKPLEENSEVAVSYPRRVVINEKGTIEEYVSDDLYLLQDNPARRYKKFLKRFRYNTIYCDPVFGLMRRDALEKTKLIGIYPTSDMNLLAELALRGKFVEVEEYLFYRRRHPEMSSKKNPGLRERAVWFSPKNKGKVQFSRWRWLYEFLSSISRVDMKSGQKFSAVIYTLHWSFYWWKSFIADLVRGISQMIYFKTK